MAKDQGPEYLVWTQTKVSQEDETLFSSENAAQHCGLACKTSFAGSLGPPGAHKCI